MTSLRLEPARGHDLRDGLLGRLPPAAPGLAPTSPAADGRTDTRPTPTARIVPLSSIAIVLVADVPISIPSVILTA